MSACDAVVLFHLGILYKYVDIGNSNNIVDSMGLLSSHGNPYTYITTELIASRKVVQGVRQEYIN